MSGFQSTVLAQLGSGIPGELFSSAPKMCQSYQIVSASAAYNVFGRAFSIASQGVAQAGNPGGAYVYAGILVNPKTQASFGDSSGPLNPTLTLPNNAQAEILIEGSIWVTLPAAASVGDVVIYDQTTGALSTIAPGAALPSGKSYAYANVDRFDVPSGGGLAVITVKPPTAGVAIP